MSLGRFFASVYRLLCSSVVSKQFYARFCSVYSHYQSSPVSLALIIYSVSEARVWRGLKWLKVAEIDTKVARNMAKSGSGRITVVFVIVTARWRIYARIFVNIFILLIQSLLLLLLLIFNCCYFCHNCCFMFLSLLLLLLLLLSSAFLTLWLELLLLPNNNNIVRWLLPLTSSSSLYSAVSCRLFRPHLSSSTNDCLLTLFNRVFRRFK